MKNNKDVLNVLIVEDSFDDTTLIVIALSKYYKVTWARVETEAALIVELKSNWDIVLSDFSLPSFSVGRALEVVREVSSIPFIIVSGTVDETVAIEYLLKGANDFISKNTPERLPLAVAREVREAKERSSNQLRENTRVSESYDQTIAAWGKALELRDIHTKGHTVRVTDLALRLARHLKISHDEFINLYRGSLLHDIGKMGIPDAVLLKEDILNDEEWRIMRQHPVLAYEMLKEIPFLEQALDVPRYHHERWNGTGYPEGLHGTSIPFLARMFAVVDVYDALTSDRPYRPSWEKHRVIAYLLEEAGKTFDPKVVNDFVDMIGRG